MASSHVVCEDLEMREEHRHQTICPGASAMVRSSAFGASFCILVSNRHFHVAPQTEIG